jgi:CcdB protein
MRRFEVWRLVTKDKRSAFRYVMVLQSEKIDHLSTIIVAPLRDAGSDMLIPGLTPRIDVNGTFLTVLVPLMMSIDRKLLDACVYNGDAHAYEISRAIDRVFMGI